MRNVYVYDDSSDSVKALRTSFKDGLFEENTRLTLRMVQMMDPTKRLLALRTQTHRIMAVSLVYALGILMDICLMKIR